MIHSVVRTHRGYVARILSMTEKFSFAYDHALEEQNNE